MNRVLYHEWFPQIMYNHHQTGPTGTVMFAPPFRDPFNYVYHPLVITGLDMVGAAMHNRFVAENKPGVTMRRGANYSTWWNGGLRTTTYFHNMIGLLTETIGNPTPMDIAFVPERQLTSGDLPVPIAPQKWHFRQSVDYSVTANRAVLDFASRYRETLALQHLADGARLHRAGLEGQLDDVPAPAAGREGRDRQGARRRRRGDARHGGRRRAEHRAAGAVPGAAEEAGVARSARLHPARGPGDFPTATKFVNTLIKTGVIVHRATAPFSAGGKQYPAGSYVVKTAQAFRPHVLDMFEPQDHPNDFRYPGGPPIPPYDNAGWTLAYQMGVKFDRAARGRRWPIRGAQRRA